MGAIKIYCSRKSEKKKKNLCISVTMTLKYTPHLKFIVGFSSVAVKIALVLALNFYFVFYVELLKCSKGMKLAVIYACRVLSFETIQPL